MSGASVSYPLVGSASPGASTAAANVFGNPQTMPALVLTGLSGSTAASRYVGATIYGPPTGGTYSVGDFVVAQMSGAAFVCAIAGTPGTWHLAGTRPLAFDSYAGKGTEALPATSDSGLAWTAYSSGTTATLSIISGQLTNTVNSGSNQAGFAEWNLGANATRIGADFTLSAGGTGGNAVIGQWVQSRAPIFPTVPDSGCHLTISPTQAQYAVWVSGTFTAIKTWTFGTALTQDGATAYRVEVNIVGSTAYVLLPDGTTGSVTDSRISSGAGAFAWCEVFQGNAATDCRAAFTNVWADTGTYTTFDGMPYATVRDLTRAVDAVRTQPLNLLGKLAISLPTGPLATFSASTATDYSMIGLNGTGRNFDVGTGNASETTFGVANKFFVYDSTASAMRLTIDSTGLTTINAGGLTVAGGNATVSAGTLSVTNASGPVATFAATGATAYSMIGLNGTGRSFDVGVGNASESAFGVANKFFLYDSTAGAMRLTVDSTGLLTLNPASAPGLNFNYAVTAAGSGAAPTLPANTPTGATGGALKYIAVQIQGATAYLLAAQ